MEFKTLSLFYFLLLGVLSVFSCFKFTCGNLSGRIFVSLHVVMATTLKDTSKWQVPVLGLM
jgi:hypothetical protein